MWKVEVIVGDSFPITLQCFSDGTLALVPLWNVGVMFDLKPEGVTAMFEDTGFALMEQGKEWGDWQYYLYGYPYPYKDMPVLKAWIVQQNLINPLGDKE